jgi:hypothetical protein
MKNKVIYESKIHLRDKSHDVLVIQDTKVNGVKLKMTYECYNAVERFTGDLFVGEMGTFLFFNGLGYYIR